MLCIRVQPRMIPWDCTPFLIPALWMQFAGMGAEELRQKFNFPNSAKVKHCYGPKVREKGGNSKASAAGSDRTVHNGTVSSGSYRTLLLSKTGEESL